MPKSQASKRKSKPRVSIYQLVASVAQRQRHAPAAQVRNISSSYSRYLIADTNPIIGLGYMKCCGKLHKDATTFAQSTPEQIVRARYSAYAKREVDFIVGSTHPLNKNFMSDIEHWKDTIRTNCYDNFELTSCQIISEEITGEGENQVAKVQFVAKMTQVDSREKTAFMETSTFERAGKHIANGAWLYKEGLVESAPGMPEALDMEEELKKEEKEKLRLKEEIK
eukprot:scaffold4069_cov85-Cyclotella_meneghiniana.AAC.19